MKIQQFVCDGCRAVKAETNHWISVARTSQGREAMSIYKGIVDSEGLLHLCGHECLHAKVSEFLGAKG